MEKLEVFPTTIFSFSNPNIDNHTLIQEFEKEPMKAHYALSSLENMHIKEQYHELFSWINACLQEIKDEMRYDCDSIEITSSWVNKYLANSDAFHSPHSHSMSMWSGIYYATGGAPTLFEDCVFHRTHSQIEVLQFDHNPYIAIDPEPGKLIVFPSWMFHSTVPNHHWDEDRWTVAFNTLPAGKINYNLARDSVAVIEVNTQIEKNFHRGKND